MTSDTNSVENDEHVQSTLSKYHLSIRGACNFAYRDVWGPREKSMGDPWSPSNPNGTVILRLAENSLMHEEVGEFIREQMNVLPVDHLTYSTGPRGSRRLRSAAAALLNEQFHSRTRITYDNIIVTPGLASAIDGITFAICNEGDGILIPQPLYNGFNVDIQNRSNVRVVGVKYEGIEGFGGLDDLFRPEVNRLALEATIHHAREEGINVRALLVSNPHNPLGRCYPPETLREFASFCGRNDLHLISDEIYAFSVFPNPQIPMATKFTSILSLDLVGVIYPSRMHVLYGASKDFCANGLRMGFVCTKNEGIMGAMSSIGIFSWSPHILQDAWAAMMENKLWLDRFMAQKRNLMVERYKTTTSFFAKHGIPFYEMNAGLFIWVDLRHLLVAKSAAQQSDHSALRVTSPNGPVFLRRELRIAEICMKNGVMIAPGHVYVPEEYGWFRITFTVGKEALQEGLERFMASIKQVEAERQSWK
ncbi:uncharacterized protein N7496_005525 [Penicillium cataractarum]|uniref:Aminotransferase class I/classII large domain-containing protein n=1 Tax=Penicillium cataractarum TaxID=2100454 RepID=A0A9W9VG47_9EURO|nr:uncharacterized protein N7496_005525 [Penicillium cataractarum]KAJ5378116.1 hypothetical protein N7496_005525 [Penicillium cataractarum]